MMIVIEETDTPLLAEDYRDEFHGMRQLSLSPELSRMSHYLDVQLLNEAHMLSRTSFANKNSDFARQLLARSMFSFLEKKNDVANWLVAPQALHAELKELMAAIEEFKSSDECSERIGELTLMSRKYQEITVLSATLLESYDAFIALITARRTYELFLYNHYIQIILELARNVIHSNFERLSLRDIFSSGSFDLAQRQLILDFIHAKDALVEKPYDVPFEAYAEAVEALRVAFPAISIPSIQNFKNDFWVEFLWYEENHDFRG